MHSGYVRTPDSCPPMPTTLCDGSDMWDVDSTALREAIAFDNAHRGETNRERLSPRAVAAAERYLGDTATAFLNHVPY